MAPIPASTANTPCGVLIPNRVFVGGISGDTTESDLCRLFSAYGNVKSTKIIIDRAGISKGYGFVTFETEEEALKLQLDGKSVVLKDRKLSIAPAIMKKANVGSNGGTVCYATTPQGPMAIDQAQAAAYTPTASDYTGQPNYPPSMPYQPCYYYYYSVPMNTSNVWPQNYQNVYHF